MGAFIRCRNFNPRSYKRSDFSIALARCSSFISIHAPTRGATDSIGFIVLFSRISIHAPTRGATSMSELQAWALVQFQSTLLQEERLPANNVVESVDNFNPRSYKRSDFNAFKNVRISGDFNPRSYKRSDDSCRILL